jgi:hypothetical protein
MTTTAVETKQVGRWSRIDARKLRQPAVLIFNPNASHKLGVDTNSGGSAQVQEALYNEGITCVPRPTERAEHATDLARQAGRGGSRARHRRRWRRHRERGGARAG